MVFPEKGDLHEEMIQRLGGPSHDTTGPEAPEGKTRAVEVVLADMTERVLVVLFCFAASGVCMVAALASYAAGARLTSEILHHRAFLQTLCP